MRATLLLLAALSCAVAFAGCQDDDASGRIDEEEGDCYARGLSQEPPQESSGQIDRQDVPGSCPDP